MHSCRLECLLLGFTDHQDIKRTLVAMSKRTWMTVSQVTDEVLYTGLIEMQEMDVSDDQAPTRTLGPYPKYMGLRKADMTARENGRRRTTKAVLHLQMESTMKKRRVLSRHRQLVCKFLRR